MHQVRLHETSAIISTLNESGIRYAALSHCWGRIEMIRTMEATLSDSMLEGIRWTDLPKTFQEAVLLVRELGIDYLWIDSLCKQC